MSLSLMVLLHIMMCVPHILIQDLSGASDDNIWFVQNIHKKKPETCTAHKTHKTASKD